MSKTSLDVIVVEDDEDLKKDLVDFLNIKRISTIGAENGKKFFDYLDIYNPRIVIVDLILPDIHGLEIVKMLRRSNSAIGLVILTSLNTKETIVEGYQAGADIFLSKHLDLAVLEICIKRLMTRIEAGLTDTNPPIWFLDRTKRFLIFNNQKEIKLTGKEFEVLSLLFSEAGKTFTRAELADEANLTSEGERRIDSVISRLRRKVKTELGEDFPIDQVYGKGYAFSDNAIIQTIEEEN